MIEIRKGQASAQLERTEFSRRFREAYVDPDFRAEDQAIARLEEIAWQIYLVGRKSPFTRKAGPGYADPEYELSVEWLATKVRLDENSDEAMQEETRNVARAVAKAVLELRAGRLQAVQPVLSRPRPK